MLDLSLLEIILILVSFILIGGIVLLFVYFRLQIKSMLLQQQELQKNLPQQEAITNLNMAFASVSEKLSGFQQSYQNTINTLNQALTSNFNNLSNQMNITGAELKASKVLEEDMKKSLEKIERVFSGSKTRGLAGENVLAETIHKLPPDRWQKNVNIDGKVVEYAFKLRNGKLVPIDSKWPEADILQKISIAKTQEDINSLQKTLSNKVLIQAKDVRKYINVPRTTEFALMIVPNAAIDFINDIMPHLYSMHIVVVSHSMLINYLLLLDALTPLQQYGELKLEHFFSLIRAINEIANTALNSSLPHLDKGLAMVNNARLALADNLKDIERHAGNSLQIQHKNIAVNKQQASPHLPPS